MADDLPDFSQYAVDEDTLNKLDAEAAARMEAIQASLVFPAKHPALALNDGVRQLLREGALHKKGTKAIIRRTTSCYSFLFTDLLLITTESKGKYDLKHCVLLNNATVKDRPAESALAFEVICPERTFLFLAENEASKAEWLESLVGAISEVSAVSPESKHQVLTGTLFSAALSGDAASMRQLLATAATAETVDALDEDGRTAAHYAAQGGNVEVLGMLLQAGGQPDIPDNELQTPLHLACKAAEAEAVEYLLSAGADVNAQDMQNWTPAMMCVLAAVQTTREGGGPGTADTTQAQGSGEGERRSKFDRACDSLQCAVRHGADVNKVNCNENSALLVSCHVRGHMPRVAQLLLKAGAVATYRRPKDGATALHIACVPRGNPLASPDGGGTRGVSVAMLRLLLNFGAQPNIRDKRGGTPLHLLLTESLALRRADTAAAAAATAAPAPPVDAGAPPVAAAAAASPAPTSCASLATAAQLLVSYGARVDLTAGASTALALAQRLGLNLEPSFQQYNARAAPPQSQAIAASDLPGPLRQCARTSPQWQADQSSASCTLCATPFTFTVRRHHCRRCGRLTCAPCTTQRFILAQSRGAAAADSSAAPDAPVEPPSAHRVCSGCFNSLCHYVSQKTATTAAVVAGSRQQGGQLHSGVTAAAAAATATGGGGGAARPPSAARQRLAARQEEREQKRAALLARSGGSSRAPASKPWEGTRGTMGETQAALNDSKEALQLRGQKLQQLNEKTERMATDAQNFASLARQLRQQEERNSSWLPF